ncbi:MAG: Holliday junction branch migration DNA helicase RuvB [Planctomycetota bacterium]
MDANPLDPEPLFEEQNSDIALRPRSFAEFVGQDRVKSNLKVYIRAARMRDDPLDHLLLSGLPGLGKTTLAEIVAREMDASLNCTSGPALEKPGDLAGVLTNLERGDVLFIDEIHRLPASVEEFLYSAMEDFTIDIVLDQGPRGRSVRLDIQRFTLVGATTREGMLSPPFRDRFGVLERLEPYPIAELELILERSAKLLGVNLDPDGCRTLAAQARGTPRVANRFLRRIRDLAQVESAAVIDQELAGRGLAMLGVDKVGLLRVDRMVLETIALAEGQPVGLRTIAVSVGEDDRTIEDVYEPHLIRCGYLLKTARGRQLTARGYEVLGAKPASAQSRQPELFDGLE